MIWRRIAPRDSGAERAERAEEGGASSTDCPEIHRADLTAETQRRREPKVSAVCALFGPTAACIDPVAPPAHDWRRIAPRDSGAERAERAAYPFSKVFL